MFRLTFIMVFFLWKGFFRTNDFSRLGHVVLERKKYLPGYLGVCRYGYRIEKNQKQNDGLRQIEKHEA